mmetsp:Transcript_9944/g.27054  ORF Transcript_9944/g.27054 Transcript_9944/m.27054 type:complete len:202 (+) Transcript_9944:1650-2255(+)
MYALLCVRVRVCMCVRACVYRWVVEWKRDTQRLGCGWGAESVAQPAEKRGQFCREGKECGVRGLGAGGKRCCMGRRLSGKSDKSECYGRGDSSSVSLEGVVACGDTGSSSSRGRGAKPTISRCPSAPAHFQLALSCSVRPVNPVNLCLPPPFVLSTGPQDSTSTPLASPTLRSSPSALLMPPRLAAHPCLQGCVLCASAQG